jgi:acetyl-CoA acetyltransferase family protein
MRDAHIPYGLYWSTPFARWQGSLSHLHSVELAAHVARRELSRRDVPPSAIDHAVLGTTVPQKHSFYGVPWLTGMMGAPGVTGPTVNQACATSARCLSLAASAVQGAEADVSLVVTTDRCSNGPHLYYPDPKGAGGTGAHEDWVLDNFGLDPFARVAMVDTAENVAKKWGITLEEQHEVTLQRYAQYARATDDGSAFLKRYMTLPFEVPDARFKKTVATLDGDEGIHPTTREGLAKLKPVKDGGTVTYGSQTHPADGGAAIVVTTRERAAELSRDRNVEVKVLGFGQARVEPAFMPAATVPAARRALAAAGLSIDRIDAVKSHNPFAVNDIVFAREMGVDVMAMNDYGSSLVWGHPQGPTGLRAVIELIELLAMRGGGRGLFFGCAAGDSAMAAVISVGG